MVWLIMLAGFAMVLAPVMWILPSPAQKAQAQMRESARKLGLQVRVGVMPLTHVQRVRREDAEHGVCYTAMLRRKANDTVPAWQWWLDEDLPKASEVSTEQMDALRLVVKNSGLEVKILEYNHTGFGCWWREKGDAQTVVQMAQLLTSCLDILNVAESSRTHRNTL